MACKCIECIDAKLAERNSKLEVGFTFGTADTPGYEFPSLRTEKIDKRNRDKIGAIPTFCPFCGTAYRAALPLEAFPDLLETLQWVRKNYAGGSTKEINARIDAAISKATQPAMPRFSRSSAVATSPSARSATRQG